MFLAVARGKLDMQDMPLMQVNLAFMHDMSLVACQRLLQFLCRLLTAAPFPNLVNFITSFTPFFPLGNLSDVGWEIAMRVL